ncbi:Uncharacterised protein [uncultured archaeon]|nr:Uncharacterised protein [uncultured archaeon]
MAEQAQPPKIPQFCKSQLFLTLQFTRSSFQRGAQFEILAFLDRYGSPTADKPFAASSPARKQPSQLPPVREQHNVPDDYLSNNSLDALNKNLPEGPHCQRRSVMRLIGKIYDQPNNAVVRFKESHWAGTALMQLIFDHISNHLSLNYGMPSASISFCPLETFPKKDPLFGGLI